VVDRTKVVVIGGSGFLGSHVADQLTLRGHLVTVFDKVPSRWIRSGQEMIVGDIFDVAAVEKAVEGASFVFNFAGLADLDEARRKPIETIRFNILGNSYILEACRKNNVRRFIYASTVYVYSREGGFYRCSKQAAEHYIEEYQRTFNLDYTILRYGSLYGPRCDQKNSLFRIIQAALETGVVRYEGSPEAMREYIHVEDAAIASVDMLKDDFRNQSVVLMGKELMKVEDLLKTVAEILGIPNSVEFVNKKLQGHYVRTPYAYEPKIGRKYSPNLHVDLGQGLLQLIAEIEKNSRMRDERKDISRDELQAHHIPYASL